VVHDQAPCLLYNNERVARHPTQLMGHSGFVVGHLRAHQEKQKANKMMEVTQLTSLSIQNFTNACTGRTD